MTTEEARLSENPCKGCGHDLGAGNPPADHCGNCPPWTCEDCGQPCSMADPCGCWIPLDGLPLANLKAVFATADLTISTPQTEGA